MPQILPSSTITQTHYKKLLKIYSNSPLQNTVHKIHRNKKKKHRCEYPNCNKFFTQVSNLKRHYKLHTGEKPFTCKICKKTFVTATNLKQHEQTHIPSKFRAKYPCDECTKTFLNKSTLVKHLKTHKKKIQRKSSTQYSVNVLPSLESITEQSQEVRSECNLAKRTNQLSLRSQIFKQIKIEEEIIEDKQNQFDSTLYETELEFKPYEEPLIMKLNNEFFTGLETRKIQNFDASSSEETFLPACVNFNEKDIKVDFDEIFSSNQCQSIDEEFDIFSNQLSTNSNEEEVNPLDLTFDDEYNQPIFSLLNPTRISLQE